MFYDTFAQLCYENRTTPNAVCAELGLSNSTATYWKKSGKAPKRETLEKLSARFGVPIDYLIGRETKNADYTETRVIDVDIEALLKKIERLPNIPAEEFDDAKMKTVKEAESILLKLDDDDLNYILSLSRRLLDKSGQESKNS